MNKVLTDFGEAALLGVKAICDGQVTPMNPNEATRSQVYLHNNIFFSRAVDAGMETFKVAKGDRAARKSASRDLHCLGALHRMEKTGLYTLATVLIDFLGTRYVCQSILPGILNGEKTHTLLYGAVEAGTPLVWDKEMHELLESTLGVGLMIATRPMAREPLTAERAARIEAGKVASQLSTESKQDEMKNDEHARATIDICAPLEAKGIRGSDQRKYVLDMTRLTPRDANWVRKEMGGTGNWESLVHQTNGSSKSQNLIPKDLNDDEWTLAVLRSELVTVYAQMRMAKYLRDKKEKGEGDDNHVEATVEVAKDDLEYVKTLRFNVNVFLPDIKTLEGIDAEAFDLVKKDEEMVRSASSYLWDEVIPGVTMEIRQGSVNTIPHDGKSLTEFIHQRGINCRYLGRLATLSQAEELKDRQQLDAFDKNQISKLDRRKMPLFWLELLECEMVARSAKHVLDRYLTADGATAASNPAQTVASFLCALVSESEETAAQTENRMDKRRDDEPDEDDLNALTFYQAGGGGDATPNPVRGRFEVWKDIEEDIGRRFRYNLTIFNRSNKTGRVMHVPLLRRVCQRTGVRLAAKSYEIGGKCYCSDGSTGGHIIASYPISALDVFDIVPLMKHGAAHGEGFVPCSVTPGIGIPALHISLPDARAALESAHLHHSKRLLSRALDLAQEAAGLYQRVCETPAHPGVVRCVDLMGTILYDAGEPALAAANAGRALGFQVQISGFDSSDVINLHFVMFQFLMAAGQPSKAVKHIRAAIYLMELMGGTNHVELSNAYHKVGTVYHGVSDLKTALRFYQEATSRESSDRLLEGMISKSSALVLAGVGDFLNAVKSEKRAFKLFSVLLGANHTLTKQSDQALAKLTSTAVAHGNRMVDDLNKKKEEEAAEAIAHEIEAEEKAAEEAAEDEKRKKRNSKKKKGKK
jgi:protein TIF31